MAFLLEEHSRLDFWNGGDGLAVVMYGLEKVVLKRFVVVTMMMVAVVMMVVTIIMVAVVMIFKRLMMVTVVMGEMPGIA